MRKISFTQNEYYHIFNRGVDKRITFTGPEEYQRFLYILYLSNSPEPFKLDNITKYQKDAAHIFTTPRSKTLVSIHSYCLMSNHYHLLVSENSEGGISAFMQKISTAYTMFFNKKHKRSGSLFEGTFKAVLVENDTHFKYLFSYIHANPFSIINKDGSIQIKDIEKIFNYPYSSIAEYRGETRLSSALLTVLPFIQEELRTTIDAKRHLVKWLDFHSN